MANTLGALIKEARTAAKLTQEQLAAKVEGLAAADLSKAERGQKELSQNMLKQIAKATGVTQASLLNAAKADAAAPAKKAETKKADAKQTAAKKSEAKKAETKKATTKKTETKKTETKKDDGFTLTAAEKKLVELYRAADSDTRKAAVNLLKGIQEEPEAGDLLSALQGLASNFLGGKK